VAVAAHSTISKMAGRVVLILRLLTVRAVN
jgi:hypothetical protein